MDDVNRVWPGLVGLARAGVVAKPVPHLDEVDWVVWEQADGDTRGRVVRSITADGETFDDSEYTGDANVPQADEGDPVYLIEVWGGFGDDASARESNQSGPDTVHVVHLESRMTEVEDPRDREAAAAGLLERAKSLLTPGSTDDAGDSAEDSEDIDMKKVGRTLSRANVAEAKAVHDAAATMLEREGHDDHKAARTYTDDPDDGFEMAEHHAKIGEILDTTDGEDAAEASKDADSTDTETTGAESPADDDTTEHMSDETTDDTEKATEEPPAWAEALTEKVETIEARVDEIDDETEKMADAPEWAQDLAEKVDGLDNRVDKIAKAEADTDQVAGTEDSAETTDEASAFKAALGGD